MIAELALLQGWLPYVRLGSIAIAIGMSVITIAHWNQGKVAKLSGI
jgi:hypothetical protein